MGGGSAFHGEVSVFTYVKLNNVAKEPIMENLEFLLNTPVGTLHPRC